MQSKVLKDSVKVTKSKKLKLNKMKQKLEQVKLANEWVKMTIFDFRIENENWKLKWHPEAMYLSAL